VKVTEGLERIRAFFPDVKMFDASGGDVDNVAIFEETVRRLHAVALERFPKTPRELASIMDKHGVGVRNGVISLD
jgi:hypothetical protein